MINALVNHTTREKMKMKKIVLILTIMISMLYGGSVFATSVIPGEVLVKYKTGKYPNTLSGGLGKIGWGKVRLATHESMNP